MYLSCPTINRSLSSCCDQLTMCPHLGRNKIVCASRATSCLSDVRSKEGNGFTNGNCDRALERTRQYLSLDYLLENSLKKDRQRPDAFADPSLLYGLLLIISISWGICLLLVTCMHCRIRAENQSKK
ncbi:hypothetical protein PMAYCL1PPCAC_00784, partial [Pristionchus mayeri]